MRSVARIIDSQVAPVGTFTVRRALPDPTTRSIGPWVFLDHFGPFRVTPGKDGVGAHPHAGIETVTYILSGRQRHRDSAGHEGIVAAGGAQWMTSGRGIVHAETPVPETEADMTLHGIQLWTTLPRALKMMAPRYQNIAAADIAVVPVAGGAVRVVAGEFGGRKGPADALMPLFLWHVVLEPGAALEAPLPAGFEAGAYVIAGEGAFAGKPARAGQLAVFADGDAALTARNTGTAPLEFMLLGGAPAEGPLVFHGPFVMNSVEQVRYAEKAYHMGKFGEVVE